MRLGVKQRWALVLAVTVLGALAGAAAGGLAGESYQADAIFIVVPDDPTGEVEDELGLSFSRLATRRNVVGPALSEAGYDEVAREPESAISARASVDTPSFAIEATAASPDDAAGIASTAALALEEFTRSRSGRVGYRVALIGPPSPPAEQSSLSASLGALAGGAFGLSLALLVALTRRPG